MSATIAQQFDAMAPQDAPVVQENAAALIVAKDEPSRALAIPAEPSIEAILYLAVERGAGVEALERIVALKERMEDRAAAKEFADALARFQRKCPVIPKSTIVDYTTKAGQRVNYKHAELDEIAITIRGPLHDEGLSYTWDSVSEGAKLKTICTLRHLNGHSTTSTFICSTDNPSPLMTPMQKDSGAYTYGRRQTLVGVLGLTTGDRSEPEGTGADEIRVTDDQALHLSELADEVGVNRTKFLKYLKAESFDRIRAADYDRAVNLIEAKRAEGKRI